MYCFDPRHFVVTPFGHPKTGAYRAQFMLESVQDLKAGLQKIGSDLIIHLGKPEDAIAGVSPWMSLANLWVARNWSIRRRSCTRLTKPIVPACLLEKELG